MKKLMLLAALGAAAIFTACSDDSSSTSSNGGDESCTVSVTDSSVTQVTVYGETTTAVWIVRGDSIVHTMEGPAVDTTNGKEFVYPKGDQTVETLKADADKSCKETEELWAGMDKALK